MLTALGWGAPIGQAYLFNQRNIDLFPHPIQTPLVKIVVHTVKIWVRMWQQVLLNTRPNHIQNAVDNYPHVQRTGRPHAYSGISGLITNHCASVKSLAYPLFLCDTAHYSVWFHRLVGIFQYTQPELFYRSSFSNELSMVGQLRTLLCFLSRR